MPGKRSAKWLDANFKILEEAVLAGERCPKNDPYGPIDIGAIPALVRAKRIRSEIYSRNYRVVTILVGPFAGKSTAPAPSGAAPYQIDGVRVT